jgi:hypothetical protein
MPIVSVVGKTPIPDYLRYFLWEMSETRLEAEPHTVIGEWTASVHLNHGAGPPFSANFATDCAKLLPHVVQLCVT